MNGKSRRTQMHFRKTANVTRKFAQHLRISKVSLLNLECREESGRTFHTPFCYVRYFRNQRQAYRTAIFGVRQLQRYRRMDFHVQRSFTDYCDQAIACRDCGLLYNGLTKGCHSRCKHQLDCFQHFSISM